MASVEEDLQEKIEGIRSKELWTRYDTYVVGKEAAKRNASWDDSFLDMSARDTITFFDGSRTKQVAKSKCNVSGATEDWAQQIYHSGVEFIAPTGHLGQVQNANDATFFPGYWVGELAHHMSVSIKLQDTDEVLLLPMSHLPGGTGQANAVADGFANAVLMPGTNGPGSFKATWEWPEGLVIPAKKKMVMEVTLDTPVREFFQGLPSTVPGLASVVNNDANGVPVVTNRKLWFMIRCWHRGPRRVQLRGAMTA